MDNEKIINDGNTNLVKCNVMLNKLYVHTHFEKFQKIVRKIYNEFDSFSVWM